MPLDNSGTKMVLNRYGNLITTKDRTGIVFSEFDVDLICEEHIESQKGQDQQEHVYS